MYFFSEITGLFDGLFIRLLRSLDQNVYGKNKICSIIGCSWPWPIFTLSRRSGEHLRTFRSSSFIDPHEPVGKFFCPQQPNPMFSESCRCEKDFSYWYPTVTPLHVIYFYLFYRVGANGRINAWRVTSEWLTAVKLDACVKLNLIFYVFHIDFRR